MRTAPTWDALAVALNMPVREIYRARKLAGAPQGKDVDDWQEWFKRCNSLDLKGLPPTSYDGAMTHGKLSPDDALKHSRLVEQEIINEHKREELAILRGSLIPKDKYRERVTAIADKIRAVLATLPDLAAEALEPHERPAMRKRAELWRDTLLTKIAEAVGASGN